MRGLFCIFIFLSSFVVAQRPAEAYVNCASVYSDVLWMSKTEVTNLQYKTFLHQKKDSLAQYTPDTTCWGQVGGDQWSNSMYYFRHPAYDNYPVVGLSLEQVSAFCYYLKEQINKNHEVMNPHLVKKVHVRLPQYNEWLRAARVDGGGRFPWVGNSLRYTDGKHQGEFRCNFKIGYGNMAGVAGGGKDHFDITAPVTMYEPSIKGFYNMVGNVAELMANDSMVVGGDWFTPGSAIGLDAREKFHGPSPRVGFRYVIEVVEEYGGAQKKFNLNQAYLKNYFSNIEDSLLVGKFEVSNELYNYYLESEGLGEQLAQDWSSQMEYSRHLDKGYSSLEEFRSHPVVNVTPEEVLLFLKWFENQYAKVMGKAVDFYIPTAEEWYFAACSDVAGRYYAWQGTSTQSESGEFMCNYNVSADNTMVLTPNTLPSFKNMEVMAMDGFQITAPVDAYYESDYGLFNVCGNVAELVKVGDAYGTKGGSWNDSIDAVQLKYIQEFQPSIFNGFRIFGRFQ